MGNRNTVTPLAQRLFVIFIATSAIMSVFELSGMFLAPGMPGLQYNLITIAFTSLLAVIVAWFPLRSFYREYYRTLDEMERRELAEQNLRKNEEQYRALIETTSTGYVILDESGKVLDANPEYVRLSGHRELGQILGRSMVEWTADHEKEKNEAALGDCIRNGSIRNLEVDYTDPSGNILPVEINATVVHGNGSPRILSLCRDITDRRKASEALRASEEKYRMMIENMQDLFYQTDPDGNLTMISPYGAELAGYNSPDEMIGINVAKEIYADPKEREQFLALLKKTGRVTSVPIILKARDGTRHYLTASSQFFYDGKGNVKGVEGILHDITPQRLAENALKQANRQLNLMTSITRHDILNQLLALQGYIQLSGKYATDPEKIRDFIEKETRVAKNIEGQIRFTRLYQNMGVNEPVWQDVNVCVAKAAGELPTGEVYIETTTPGVEIYADPMFEKVFYNLIDNALRYGGSGLKKITISSHESDENLILVCEDDGDGILPDSRPHLFERGYGKNTGLGLFLVREILAITGITISENGMPGHGARFEIVVPKGEYRYT